MSNVINLTDTTFHETIASSDVPVLVDFWATWCQPCLKVAPVLAEIADEQATLKIAKIDVDQFPTVAREFNVMSIPTMIVFRDGKPAAKIVGAKNKAQLLKELAAFL